MLEHEYKLQQIADANGGNRLAGTAGNDKTVNYIAQTMRGAGWKVRKQPFQFPFYEENSTPLFADRARRQDVHAGHGLRDDAVRGLG